MEFLEIDGSQGEGGGQILRNALAFSVILGRPVRVSKVRAGREVPGLRRQHVSTLRVLGEIFGGELTGAVEGSSQVSFKPGATRLRNISLDMGTAASITLVLQAVIPAAALSGSKVSLELTGGTDVPWSPTFDYFDRVAREGYLAAGISFNARALRRGYYPRGGGRVAATVEPSEGVEALNSVSPLNVKKVSVLSRSALLPAHVSQRQLAAAVSVLREAGYVVEAEAASEDADSPGSSVLAFSSDGGALIGCDSLGQKGRPSEAVGAAAAEELVSVARSGATLDGHVGDMVLPLLSMASGTSRVTVPRISPHLETGLAIAKLFTSCSYSYHEVDGMWIVEVTPAKAR